MSNSRPVRRISWIVGLACVLLPASASGAVTVGSNLDAAPIDEAVVCTSPLCTTAHQELPAGSTAAGGLRAPTDGVVVRWRIKVGAETGAVALRITRPGNSGTRTGAGTSAEVTPATDQISTFGGVRLPISVGDALGIDFAGNTTAFAGTADATSPVWDPALADDEQPPRGSSGAEAELLVNADIEADGDGDGFGDETQDLCPTDPSTQGLCPVDTTPPDTTIDSGPPAGGTVDDNDPSFTFSSTEPGSSFECRLDGGTWGPCSSPRAYTDLPDGLHTFEVRATDGAGNTDQTPASRSWTIDTNAAPSADAGLDRTVGTEQAGVTLDGSGSSDPDGDDLAYSWTQTGGPNVSLSGASTAAPSFDAPVGAATLTFELGVCDDEPLCDTDTVVVNVEEAPDTSPPNTTIDSGPAPGSITDDNDPSLAFSSSEAGSSFECRLDGGVWGTCVSPKAYADLPDGSHKFDVRATDGAGNTDPTPAFRIWTIDTSSGPGPGDQRRLRLSVDRRPEVSKRVRVVAAGFASSRSGLLVYADPSGGACPRAPSNRGSRAKTVIAPTFIQGDFRLKAGVKLKSRGRHSFCAYLGSDEGSGYTMASKKRKVLRPRLQGSRARRIVTRAIRTHKFAGRVVKHLERRCRRKSRTKFSCRFSSVFPGYRLKGRGTVRLDGRLRYRFRVRAGGKALVLTNGNEGRFPG